MNYRNKISVSVMCSDLLALGKDIRKLEELGADMLHIDVMDAHFVPNLTFGPDFIRAMQAFSKLPVDCHFMVTDPDLMFRKVQMRPGDIFSPHAEVAEGGGLLLTGQHTSADGAPARNYGAMADAIHAQGGLFGLVLNPETPVDVLEPNIGWIDTVTLMLVHPGAAGARMIDGIMEKVGETRRWLDARGLERVEISVDGSVSAERAAYMTGLGASIFVGGSAGIYIKGRSLDETIPEFRAKI